MESKSDAGPQEPDRSAYFAARRDAGEFGDMLDQFVEDGTCPIAVRNDYGDWQDDYWRVIIEYWDMMQAPYMEYTFLHPDSVVPGAIKESFENMSRKMRYMYQQIGQLALHEPPPRERHRMMLQWRAERIEHFRQRGSDEIAQAIMQDPPPPEPESTAARAARTQALQQRWVHMLNDVARKLAYYGVEEAKRIADGFVWETNDASIPADVTDNIEPGYL